MMIKAALLVEDYDELMKRHGHDGKFIQFMRSARIKTRLYNHRFYLIMTWENCPVDSCEILRNLCEEVSGDYISVDESDKIVYETYIGLIDVDIRIIEAV